MLHKMAMANPNKSSVEVASEKDDISEVYDGPVHYSTLFH